MSKKSLARIGAAAVFCALALALFLLWKTSLPAPHTGGKTVTVEVVHKDGSTVEFVYETDLEYLGELVTQEQLASGSSGPYGLFVDTVDGETADYAASQSWWKLSCNGQEAQTGADAVVLEDGAVYTWTYMDGAGT